MLLEETHHLIVLVFPEIEGADHQCKRKCTVAVTSNRANETNHIQKVFRFFDAVEGMEQSSQGDYITTDGC